jgi:hypothetical protein
MDDVVNDDSAIPFIEVDNDDNDDDAAQEKEHFSSKRLRSAEPDLTIVLHYTEEVVNVVHSPRTAAAAAASITTARRNIPKTKSYREYSQLMATVSGFVDTTLSVPMKEKTERIIEFNNVTPHLYETAMQFVMAPLLVGPSSSSSGNKKQKKNDDDDSPGSHHRSHTTTSTGLRGITTTPTPMMFRDAIELAGFYHMYDFHAGKAQCDRVIAAEFELPANTTTAAEMARFDSVQNHWTAWCQDNEALLTTTTTRSNNDNNNTDDDDEYNQRQQHYLDRLLAIMRLTIQLDLEFARPILLDYVVRHLRKLSHLYRLDHIQSLHDLFQDGLLLDAILPIVPSSREEIESPLFPKYFFLCLSSLACKDCTARRLGQCNIRISGTSGKEALNGLYEPWRPSLEGHHRYYRCAATEGGGLLCRIEFSTRRNYWKIIRQMQGTDPPQREIMYSTIHGVTTAVSCPECQKYPPCGRPSLWTSRQGKSQLLCLTMCSGNEGDTTTFNVPR